MKNLLVILCLGNLVIFNTALADNAKRDSTLRVLSYDEEDKFFKNIGQLNKEFSPRKIMKADGETRTADKDFVRVSQGAYSPSIEINGQYFSTGVVTYMPQRFAGDTCTFLSDDELKKRGLARRMCAEGQIRHNICDFAIVDTASKIRAVHRFDIPGEVPNYPANCQGSIGYGVGNKQTGSLLMTLRYHFTNRPLAGSIQAVGSNSFETTRLLRINEKDGQIVVTEDNRCLGENNLVPDIPTARKLLKKCPVEMQ